MNEVECPNCGKYMKSLAGHWSKAKDCDYPKLPKEIVDISIGLLLGDGTITKNYKNPVIQVKMVNKEYLEYLSDKFDYMGLEVKLHKTGDEQAEMNRNSGFRPDAKGENYQDVYRWMTRAHPEFNQFRDWYKSEGKIFPKNIDISPELLKCWYVCDGDLSNGKRVRISSRSQELDGLMKYFDKTNLPNPTSSCNRIYWSVKDSKEILDYMGNAPPGFEYKWP